MAAVVAVALVVVAVVFLTRDSSTPSATQRPSSVAPASSSTASSVSAVPTDVTQLNAAQSLAAAQSWVAANLSGDVPIMTTPGVAAALQSRGFTAVRSAPASSAVTKSWLVTVGSAGASAAELRASTPVARFGSGARAVQVRYAVPGWTQRSVEGKLGDEMVNRVTAGSGLAVNPRIVASEPIRRALRSGSLDFRAASLLALLSQDTTVTVLAITGNAAETAVLRPARRITIKAANPAILARTVAGLGARFRPGSTSGGAGSTTLTWSIAVDPAQPVS